jgi:outer membrane protein TolC
MHKHLLLLCSVISILSIPSSACSEEVLTFKECLDAALEHNQEVKAARHRVEEVGGERWVVQSRYLPHVDLLGLHDRLRPEGSSVEESSGSTVQVGQRLFEFGKDLPIERQFREDRRQALYGYEATSREILSQVRRAFFTVLLRREQIQIRRASLEGFQERWRQVQAKRQEQMADPLEALSAELDVLTEEDAINRLEREQLRQQLELFRLIGRPIGTLETELRGSLTDFTMEEEQAVAIALKNSIPVALAEERVWEQERVVRQMVWEYLPDLTVDSGMIREKRRFGLNLSSTQKTWGLDFTSRFDARGERRLSEELFPDGRDWFVIARLTLPLVNGLAREGQLRQERERLRQVQAVLQNERDLVEVRVRSGYQAMVEAKQARELQERRVQIARRRFEIYERFRELGKVDDDQVEIFRNLFFQTQDGFFRQQDAYITAQENLRQVMGYFEE